jgi:hypothetical protein
MEAGVDALCAAGGSLSTVEVVKGMISRAERVLGLCDAERRCMAHARGKTPSSHVWILLAYPAKVSTTVSSQPEHRALDFSLHSQSLGNTPKAIPQTQWQALGARIR